MRALALAAMLALPALAQAAPPPEGSEDWLVMQPYAAWIAAQHDALGRLCCSTSDARPVEVRRRGDHWEVRFTRPEELPAPAPIGWQLVADTAILRDAEGRAVPSPEGLSIAWWYGGEVRCFTVPGAS